MAPPRSESILIRLTPGEARIFKRAAKRAGLGVGPWLRSLGMRGESEVAECPECDAMTGESYRGHEKGCSRGRVG